MGCGAMCGDSGVDKGGGVAMSINSMNQIIPLLQKTSALADHKTYDVFLASYRLDAKRFHLKSKAILVKDEPVQDDVLLRWKMVLFGLDGDHKSYSNCLGLPQNTSSDVQSSFHMLKEADSGIKSTIVYHDCFSQIDKDLHRTFQLPQGKRREFQNVLKRIANFFPKVGYTQGMNFIIGFLIILGYSQTDTFWIFTHIALNKRYLLLGLYEDGFPLNNVFCIVFKNMLKRLNHDLYLHLFEDLMMDISMWVFKWFMTCFVYSFPIEMGKYAWDVMVQLGGLGIIALAFSLTSQLSTCLMEKQEMADISQFLKDLQEVEIFNHFINMENVVKKTYEIEIVPSDFEGVEQSGGFYGIYFRQNCRDLQRHHNQGEQGLPKFTEPKSHSHMLLDKWYQTLLEERLQFMQVNKMELTSDFNLPIQSCSKDGKKLEVIDVILFSKDEDAEEDTAVEGKGKPGSCQLVKTEGEGETEWRRKKRSIVQYPIDSINEHIEEESRSAISRVSNMRSSRGSRVEEGSIISKQSKASKKSKNLNLSELDQLDKISHTFYQNTKKSVKINNYALPIPRANLTADLSKKSIEVHPEREHDQFDGKMSTNTLPRMKNTNTLAMAGHNVLNIENYDAISVSSKNASNASKKKNDQNLAGQSRGVMRFCACKTKTEENRLSSNDKNSELASSKDQFSDKQSIFNRNLSQSEDHADQLNSMSLQNVESHRQLGQIHEHHMTNSHGPVLRETQRRDMQEKSNGGKDMHEIESQVEVIPFKKGGKKFNEGLVDIY